VISKKKNNVFTKIHCSNNFKFARIYFKREEGREGASGPSPPSPTPMLLVSLINVEI